MRLIYLLLLTVLISCQPDISQRSDFKTYPKGDPLDSLEVVEPTIIYENGDSLYQFQEHIKGWPWKYLVIHCTFSQVKSKPAPLSVFTNYWRDKLGWGDTPGYLAIIRTNGDIAFLTNNNFDRYITSDEITYGVKGLNRYSIHIAIEGMAEYRNGRLVNAETRTPKQRQSLNMLVQAAREIKPDIMVVGHRDVQIYTNKSCPNFDVLDEYGSPYKTSEMNNDSLHIKLMKRVKLLN